MNDRILNLIGDAVAEIFYKVSEEYGIFCGDCPPDIEYDIETAKKDLAEVMWKALDIQIPES